MPTYILGINAFHADAAVVLLRDGEVAAALAEERLNRVKHYAGFPRLALRKALDMGGIAIGDLDHIAIGRASTANLRQKLAFSLKNLGRIGKLARQRLENRAQIQDIPALVAETCEVPRSEIRARFSHVEHHLCHAASAFLPSPFDRAAILTVDGFGDFASAMLARGDGRRIEVLDRVLFPHSLGILYSAVCQFIGYDRYGDEGKVMGLAPYGAPSYLDFMRELVREAPSGKYELNLEYFRHHSEGVDYSADAEGHPTAAPLFSSRLSDRLGEPRERGAELTQRDKDLARSLQERLEEVYFHILRDLHVRTGLDALCVAGGVALNSVANGKVFANTPFRRFHGHPAATDDGTAFGAACFVHSVTLGKPRGEPLRHAYLGPAFSDREIETAIERAGLKARHLNDEELFSVTAERLEQGRIVGWFQGRMEWGPRALGARSIVAHPGLASMKDTLNARIKHREAFRPFAPSILEERVGDYFEQTWPSDFMMQVYPTRPERRREIQAADHVDHTGRLQTVNKQACPRYHRLIEAFEARTGIPVVLNTSFNENEPIVCRPDEAIACYQRTRMDVLVMGNWFMEKAAV
ncbi:MAG: carbamoyltransferase [Proteobacteria bacterium]|nr:carbamoyltransferase [Pseudomonadota bacterium]